MADPNAKEDKKLASSPEMSKFFRALAIANANAIQRVMNSETTDKKISRAKFETRRLVSEANLLGNHKCPAGMIWDESQKRCVPLG